MCPKTALPCLLLLLAPLSPLECRAAEPESCLDDVRQCLALTGGEKDHCFQSVAARPACSGSGVGRLAERRSQFSTSVPNGAEAGPSFLGPQLIDKACLANFDSAWSAALVKGSPSPETYASLTTSLDRCARGQASEMIHP